MKIQQLPWILLLLLGFNASAQIVFEKGYLVDEKGDTLRGEVKVNPKKEHDNFAKVFFKDASGVQKNYKPTKVKAYGFANKHFVSIKNNDEDKFYCRLTLGNIILYKAAFEIVVMNETSYDYEYYLLKQGDVKLTEVKEGKFKKQIQEWMKDKPDFANDYKDQKKFDEQSAIEIINNYNAWKKSN